MIEQQQKIMNKLIQALRNEKVASVEIVYSDPKRRGAARRTVTLDKLTHAPDLKRCCSGLLPNDEITVTYANAKFSPFLALEFLKHERLYANPNGEVFYEAI